MTDIALPALLSAARRPYGVALRLRLAAAGFDDLPARSGFVLGSVERGLFAMGPTASAMGVSKQAISTLVDTLVNRGYLQRGPDPDDRRRLLVELTERGRAAAAEVRAATDVVTSALVAQVGAAAVEAAADVLVALADLDAAALPGVAA